MCSKVNHAGRTNSSLLFRKDLFCCGLFYLLVSTLTFKILGITVYLHLYKDVNLNSVLSLSIQYHQIIM